MNLQLEWVNAPKSDWIDDIESMAEGYPFEKRKKELRNGDRATRCRATWTNNNTGGQFLAGFFEKKLVGWIHVRRDGGLSDELGTDYRVAEWELIQRNRDDVRAQLLEGIRTRYPESIVQFRQPSQNRTARNFYLGQPDVSGGPTDLVLGRRTGDNPPDATDFPVIPLSELDSLEAMIPEDPGGVSPCRTLLKPGTAKRRLRRQFDSFRERDSAGGFVDESTGGIILYDYETTVPDGATPSGRIPYLRIGSSDNRQGARDLVRAAETELARAGVVYTEARLDESRQDEYEDLVDAGFNPLTKNMYFVRLPEGSDSPLG